MIFAVTTLGTLMLGGREKNVATPARTFTGQILKIVVMGWYNPERWMGGKASLVCQTISYDTSGLMYTARNRGLSWQGCTAHDDYWEVEEKGKDLTQSGDKNPMPTEMSKMQSDNTKTPPKSSIKQ